MSAHSDSERKGVPYLPEDYSVELTAEGREAVSALGVEMWVGIVLFDLLKKRTTVDLTPPEYPLADQFLPPGSMEESKLIAAGRKVYAPPRGEAKSFADARQTIAALAFVQTKSGAIEGYPLTRREQKRQARENRLQRRHEHRNGPKLADHSDCPVKVIGYDRVEL